MTPLQNEYDVAVVGGGPVGSVAAIAWARKGARVVVLEADPRAARRFAGEWIHPSGVAVLDALRIGRLDDASPRAGYGFVILPGDGSEPIELPYPEGVALACPHERIVESLRGAAARTGGVDVATHARVVGVEGHRLVVEAREGRARREIAAARIVGADGRSSSVRRALGLPENSTILSYMASVELRDVELPNEGFGHVVLGGPGPALLYRIAPDVVRGCLDVPLDAGPASRTPGFLWDAFRSVLPPALVPAFRRALENGPIGWAATRFRPRAHFGRDHVALVGDAVGHVHPMTAIGMSMGFLDAQSLAATGGGAAYARTRSGHVAELLANALYHCFRRDDASATAIREATFRMLRESAFERRRTMRIMCGEETRAGTFGSAVLRVAAGAVGSTLASVTRPGGLRALPERLAAYGEWLQWPAAALLPNSVRDAHRERSTSTAPIAFWRAPLISASSNAAPRADGPELRGRGAHAIDGTRATGAEPRTVEAIARATELLVRELEAIGAALGKVPDDVLVGPGMRMMRAITATEMRAGVAARMTIGRRWLANDGIPRLLAGGRFETADLAQVLLVLLEGKAWLTGSIAGLDDGIETLLARQHDGGGFGDLRATALTCRALVAFARRSDGGDDRVALALCRAASSVTARQARDGSFAADDGNAVAATAWGLSAMCAAGAPHSAIHAAARWLVAQQLEDGSFATPESASRASTSAIALRALVEANASEPGAMDAVAAYLANAILALSDHEAPAFEALTAGASPRSSQWEEHADALEALARLSAWSKARPAPAARRRPADSSPVALGDADWVFCRERLVEVSRSFSRPIALLPRHLEVPVTVAYLLCRIADTIEDHPAVPATARDPWMRRFLEVLENGASPEPLVADFATLPGADPELVLARNLPIVLRVLAAEPEATRRSSVTWIAEMARGMALYSHRAPGADGVVALHTAADLERYCYFVAGTVGHLLTDLFLAEIGDEATPELALTLREHAEAFGAGLQLVNILKDLTDDRARRWSYVPRTACAARGIAVADLSDPARRAAAHAAVAPLFETARRHLDDGLRYVLAIPPAHAGIRRFCLVPLWMAARTLVLAKGGDAMFTAGAAVKISRDEVEAIAADCIAHAGDDDALGARYAALWADEPGADRRSAG